MALPGKNAIWRVLVTGGAGFIGSRLVRRIAAEWPNAEVTVLDDFRSGHFKNLEGFRGDLVTADLARVDLGSYFKPKQFDSIFHLASITDTRVCDQHQMCNDNIESFRNLLEYAQPNRVPITYASSAATYGISDKPNHETDPRKPANVYGFSKVQLENLADKFVSTPDNAGWKVNAVRYFNVYGPHEAHKGAMASMVYQLYLQMKQGQRPRVFKSGEHKRDFVYVDDAVECTLLAMDSGKSGIFNTGSGEARSFNDLISELNAAMGTRLEPEYIDNPYTFFQPFTQADLSRSITELGYTPQFNLAKGVKSYVEWLKG
ncbi:MAG: ADP-glyceromanno-heptose 6-epimerase [Planctomycetes bacterium]|nr:ADP-glyceromanno-heptose 6-epimerase [Planctomycetota bacterium]MCW8134122.1 ADP-glyceromanno-heptose 6-epimerase [Planctomycetota bacterium]